MLGVPETLAPHSIRAARPKSASCLCALRITYYGALGRECACTIILPVSHTQVVARPCSVLVGAQVGRRGNQQAAWGAQKDERPYSPRPSPDPVWAPLGNIHKITMGVALRRPPGNEDWAGQPGLLVVQLWGRTRMRIFLHRCLHGGLALSRYLCA